MWIRAVIVATLKYIWASPASLIGLLVGVIGLITGGGSQVRRGALEFHGGAVTWLLSRMWIRARAMTLGHVILGTSCRDLEQTRDHEHVHVRQYERWGPFFIPAYLLCSAVLWCQGKNAYLDNPFEVEAFSKFP